MTIDDNAFFEVYRSGLQGLFDVMLAPLEQAEAFYTRQLELIADLKAECAAQAQASRRATSYDQLADLQLRYTRDTMERMVQYLASLGGTLDGHQATIMKTMEGGLAQLGDHFQTLVSTAPVDAGPVFAMWRTAFDQVCHVLSGSMTANSNDKPTESPPVLEPSSAARADTGSRSRRRAAAAGS